METVPDRKKRVLRTPLLAPKTPCLKGPTAVFRIWSKVCADMCRPESMESVCRSIPMTPLWLLRIIRSSVKAGKSRAYAVEGHPGIQIVVGRPLTGFSIPAVEA